MKKVYKTRHFCAATQLNHLSDFIQNEQTAWSFSGFTKVQPD
jgi:hypothetical protein